jgi:hypothetical protein
MARIRTLKPEWATDEKLSPLDPTARLVWVYLISHGDDAGRLIDSVKLHDGILFSQTDDSCKDALAKLAELGVIRRGKTESGQRVIQITNWEKHQKVSHRNEKACLPPIAGDVPESLRNDSGAIPASTNDQRPTTYDQRPTEVAAAPPPSPAKKSKSTFEKPTVDEVKAYCVERGNAVDAEAFVAFYESKGWKVGSEPMRNWRSAVVTWEKRGSRDFARAGPAAATTFDPDEFAQAALAKGRTR